MLNFRLFFITYLQSGIYFLYLKINQQTILIMEINFYIFFLAALVPLVIGFVWYGPLFGNAWMKELGFTKESLANKNRVLTLILSYVFSLFLTMFLLPATIHQMGVYSTLAGESGFAESTGEAFTYFQDFLSNYGDRFRTFKHGALHGVLSGLFLVMPVIAIMAMVERKSVKYVAINAGYWMVTLAIMGGLICQFGM
jgi:hypothetical protein